MPQYTSKQQGVALIATLMVVIMVSVLGITVIQRTLSAKKSSNSLLDIEAACLAAESALNVGKDFVLDNTDDFAQYDFAQDTNAVWYKAPWNPGNVNTITGFSQVISGGANLLAHDPVYRIEFLTEISLTGKSTKSSALSKAFYRITANGFGWSSTASCKRQMVVMKEK